MHPNCVAVFLALCLLTPVALAYYGYRLRIPNGDRVPNPCQGGGIWEGVGHQNPDGAGVRNPFGRDFATAGFRWTQWLCRRDSDGDGATNGEELGDPDCVWSVGATPTRRTGISHPGVCPLNSAACTNDWTVCPKKFDCPAMRAEGVFVRNFTLKETTAPPEETTYMCQAFELNNTANGTHVIGSLPIIRNKNILHHMILYACSQKPEDSLFDTPKSCFMGNSRCTEMINLWGYGFEGECFNENAGALVGGAGFRYAVLELHWNNPFKTSGYKDSSGFSLYFTKRLRRYNQGVLMYGERNLVLPPRRQLIVFNQTCPGECTQAYHSETRYITWATIHMHEYGVKGRVSLWRNGTLVKELVPMHQYDYNSPQGITFNPPIEYKRGDEVKTECHFSTVKANESVFWGFDTSQEMCFSFLTYFPNNLALSMERKLGRCLSYSGINLCKFSLPGNHIESNCNVTALRNGDAATAAMTSMTANNCYAAGCNPGCRTFLNDTFWPSNACFDPKREKRMAEVTAAYPYLALGNSTVRQQVMLTTQIALYGQASCEEELKLLAQSSESSTNCTTAAAGNAWMKGLSSHDLLVIILVCVCLGFLLVFALIGLVAILIRRHLSSRSVSLGSGKNAYSFDNPIEIAKSDSQNT